MGIVSHDTIESKYGKEIDKMGRKLMKDIKKYNEIPEFHKYVIAVTKSHTNFKGLLLRDNTQSSFDNCNYYDANSMYPSMLSSERIFPKGNLIPDNDDRGKTWQEIRDKYKDKCALVTILIKEGMDEISKKYKNIDYAGLYLGLQDDKKLVTNDEGLNEILAYKSSNYKINNFGQWTLSLTNIDMDIFFKVYDVKEHMVIDIRHFEDTFRFSDETIKTIKEFKGMINDCKECGADLEATIMKKALNKTTFGKFAARLYKASLAMGEMLYCKNYPIATWIAAYGRQKEWEQIEQHIENFVYADTDSIVLTNNDKLADEVVDQKEIGKYKLEFENVTMDINSFKNYTIRKGGIILKAAGADRAPVKDYEEVRKNIENIIKYGKIKKQKIEIPEEKIEELEEKEYTISDIMNNYYKDDYEDADFSWSGENEYDEWGNIIDEDD